MRAARNIALLVGLLILASLATYASGALPLVPREQRAAVSTIIFPAQELPLNFSHLEHLERGSSCQDCHTGIASSGSALDNNLPREAECSGCHAIDRKREAAGAAPDESTSAIASGDCKTCHPGFVSAVGIARVRLPVPNLKFSHAAHIGRGTPCATCHGDFLAERVGLATRAQLPAMRTCLQCHDGRTAPEACTTCHLAEAGGVLQTRFLGQGTLMPSGVLRGAAHTMAFRTAHKYAAQNDPDFCSSCHKKDDCVECHNGVQKPMDFHAGDYVRMHALDARRNSPDCSSCHRVQSFCQGCHTRMGVSADNKGSEFTGTGLYHPPGWTEPGLAGRGPNHHSFEAQRNIQQCASCHRESFCTKCHTAQPGTRRINPHPRRWIGSRRCEALLKRSKRMCLRCHVEAQGIDCSGAP